jgi:hypothetical protein
VRSIGTQPRPRLRTERPDAPEKLDALVASAMAFDRRERPSARDLGDGLLDMAPTIAMPPAPPSELV